MKMFSNDELMYLLIKMDSSKNQAKHGINAKFDIQQFRYYRRLVYLNL